MRVPVWTWRNSARPAFRGWSTTKNWEVQLFNTVKVKCRIFSWQSAVKEIERLTDLPVRLTDFPERSKEMESEEPTPRRKESYRIPAMDLSGSQVWKVSCLASLSLFLSGWLNQKSNMYFFATEMVQTQEVTKVRTELRK